MNKYLAIYFGGASESEKSIPLTEKSQQEFMNAWGKWTEKHKDSIIDFGCPLGTTKSVNHEGVSDKKNTITSYSIVHAESHEEASSLFIAHPHLNLHPNNSIEIIEMIDIPGMEQ